MTNPKVDTFLQKAEKWQEELTALRHIVLECRLSEDYKWSQPCYTFNGKNILIVSGFKNYCALNFFKGALLNDTDELLVQAGENSNSARQIRFTSLEEIISLEPVLKTYIFQAIEVEKADLKVEIKGVSDYNMPAELKAKFEELPALKLAFESLTPGRQKAYLLYFSQAKQAQTRRTRIENYTQRILNGKGFNDCICGQSKRMPSCDGSHKHFQ